jgi:uncharacterized protein (TIGR02246 family)
MKIRLAIPLVGLAISFALSSFTQQKDAITDPQTTQKILAIAKAYDEAENNNDAAAIAALFTEDALFVTDKGLIYGRQAIEKWYADDFQEWHHSNKLTKSDLNSFHNMGDNVASSGEWSVTVQGKTGGPIHVQGYFSNILTREGNDWKIRMLTGNTTPAPAAAPSPESTPSG